MILVKLIANFSIFSDLFFQKISERVGEWLQVDLLQATFVTGVITQGRGGTDHYSQRVTSFKISFANQTNAFHYVTDKLGDDKVRTL